MVIVVIVVIVVVVVAVVAVEEMMAMAIAVVVVVVVTRDGGISDDVDYDDIRTFSPETNSDPRAKRDGIVTRRAAETNE